MKNLKKVVMVFALLLVSQDVFALTGREVMEKSDALPKGETSSQEAVLAIFRGSQVEKKVFSAQLKRYGKEVRKRITFTHPTRLEFLVIDEPGEDSSQWIKLTSGRVRRIASGDSGKPWVNSHFYNYDIGEINIDDYNYRLLGEEDVNGVKCFKVESVKAEGTQVYSKSNIYIGKNDYIPYRIEFYERGRHTKTLTFENIEKISGINTARKATMERTDGRGRSILYIRAIQYNVSIPDQRLSTQSF